MQFRSAIKTRIGGAGLEQFDDEFDDITAHPCKFWRSLQRTIASLIPLPSRTRFLHMARTSFMNWRSNEKRPSSLQIQNDALNSAKFSMTSSKAGKAGW